MPFGFDTGVFGWRDLGAPPFYGGVGRKKGAGIVSRMPPAGSRESGGIDA